MLDDILEDIERLKNATSEKLEAWKSLKKELKNRRLADYEYRLNKVDIDEAGRLSSIIRKLDERLGYKEMRSNINVTGGSPVQFDRMLELCRTEGNVSGMIDALADSGYVLSSYHDSKKINYISEQDLLLFKELLKDDVFIKCSSVLKVLKDFLGYEHGGNHSSDSARVRRLIEASKLKGDVIGAILILANKRYSLDKEVGFTKDHIAVIEKIAKTLGEEESKSPGSVCLYFYKEAGTNMFKGYFSELGIKEKKTALKAILELDHHNSEAVKWLEDSYSDLLREASFED